MERRVRFSSNPCEEIKERCGIIELQAFRGNNSSYIVKELAILDMQTCVMYHYLFKPPFSFKKLNSKAKKTNRWLMRHFHHIDWYDGYTCLANLESIMYHYCNKFTRIYTRGLEKCNWIQLYTTASVFDVTVDKSFNYQIGDVCISTKSEEHGKRHCAINNAYRLAAFLQPKTFDRSGGGGERYKYEECEGTLHQYYSRLGQENTSQDGFTSIPTEIS